MADQLKGNTMANKMAEMVDASESAQGDDQGATGGYEICIQVGADGQISVGVESADYEAAEEAGAAEAGATGASEMKPAANIRDAIQMAMDIYRAGGKVGDDQEAIDFKAGFGKKNKAPIVDRIAEVEEDETM